MGGEYGTCGGRGEVHTGLWCGNLGESDHSGDLDVDGRVILMWLLKKWDGGRGLDYSGSG
jgi:hypothetical protein